MNALAGLMDPAAIGQSVQAGFQAGMQRRKEQQTEDALKAYATNPNGDTARGVAQYDPRLGIQLSNVEAQRQQAAQQADAQARAQHQQQMGTFRKLLTHAAQSPEGWQQALGAAQSMGLDTSQIPQQYDPAWAQQQLFIADAMEKEGDKLPGIVQEVMFAVGTDDPNDPRVREGVVGVLNNKYASDYVDAQGNTRRRSTLNIPGGPQPQPFDPNEWEEVDQGGQTATPSATFSGGFRPVGINQAGVTSTYRTPAHNREVGGVANSYHTRRGPNGEPLAIDSVPPRGMSMSAYAAHLRRANPNLDVINEGDHIHVEPRG